MFLFLCSFSIAFWGCLVLFYFYLRFIKNFQIIREKFPFFSQFFTMHLNCGVVAIVRNPGGRHTLARVGLPPGFLTLWLYLPSCRFAHGYCRGLAWIYSLSAKVCSGLAQHHIECHHEAEAHHKCYGGAV